MEIVRTFAELNAARTKLGSGSKTLSFVPTMGALHEGHLSLVATAREHSDITAVSIFVNPTQFGPNEDYGVYPRNTEKDCALLEAAGADLVFMPTAAMMYPAGSLVTVEPGPVGDEFEGRIRPGHFRGVLTVVAKLFHLVKPDVAVFGQKDAQQLFLIRRMVADLNFPVRIVAGETMRAADGLALSSRNAYLKVAEREHATVLYRALCAGSRLFDSGTRSLGEIKSAMQEVTQEVAEFELDYATAVSDSEYAEHDPVPDDGRLIIAGRLGSVRLIDNMPLKKA
jgi:pantoate--beta-alanine ligase